MKTEIKPMQYGKRLVPQMYLSKNNIHDFIYDHWYAQVHGGFTYCEPCCPNYPEGYARPKKEFWLGWDYAHYGDFTAIPGIVYTPRYDEKVWTTEEILAEAYEVIDTLEHKGEE